MKNIKLLELLSKIVNEVGDLKNIKSFKYDMTPTGGEFNVLLNNKETKVKLNITEVPVDLKQNFNLPPIVDPDNKTIYNIGFNIEGNDEQFSRENYHTLIQILKTVVDIIKNSLIKYPKNSIFIFFATSKIGKGFYDPQKIQLYKLIMQQNLPPGYRMGSSKFLEDEFIFLTNK